MIKLTVLFLAYILVANAAKAAQVGEIEALVQSSIQICKSELNPNSDDAKILDDFNLIPKNEAQSCLMDCYFNKLTVIKDGKINPETFMKLAKIVFGGNLLGKETKVEQGFLKCQQEVDKRSKEKCGAGLALKSCWVEMSKP